MLRKCRPNRLCHGISRNGGKFKIVAGDQCIIKYSYPTVSFGTAAEEVVRLAEEQRRPHRPLHEYGGDVRERRLAKFRQNVAPFRLYRFRFLQENMHFAAFFKIYQILKLNFLKFDKILQILRHLQIFFAEISRKLLFFQTDFLRKF